MIDFAINDLKGSKRKLSKSIDQNIYKTILFIISILTFSRKALKQKKHH